MAGIKDWNEDDRPREKLLLKGTNALSNSELLAILINNGTKDKSAVELAKELLQKANNNLQQLVT
jgi:DNA repair protein RadC